MAKRRSNGEGTLRLRADGRWEMTIMDGFRDDGKRRFKTFYGKTQKEVKAKAKGYRDAKDSGLLVDVNYLFPEWANIWYENHRDNIAPTTQENYRYTLRILNEGFARRRITDVKPYDIEMFLKKLRRDGRSDSCLAQCRGMLYQIFKKALEEIHGVRVLTSHSCRHTYVSQMQALGVDLATIQSIVGHADIDMTQHYLHVQESIRQDAIARFSKAFTSETTDPDKPTDGACKIVQFPRVG